MPAPRYRTFIATILALAASAIAAPTTQPAGRTVHAAELPLNLDGASPQQVDWLKAFVPPTKAFDAVFRDAPDDQDDPWRLVRVSFPSPVVTPWENNNVVPCELYLPKGAKGKVPAAVVLDILDGSAIIPRGLARGLAEQGVAALYVPMACYGPRRPPGNAHVAYYADRPDKTPDNIRQTVMDIRRAKALLSILPEVEASRISLTGVSLGGIMTSLAAGVDGEFYRVVPILAGGDLATICFHARETRRIREACEAKGITRDGLADLLRPVEPLSFASRIKPATCLMVNASKDEVIPKETTAALNKAIGSPQILWVPAGHYGAILYLPNIRQRGIEFMQGRRVDTLDFQAGKASD
jgi:dienelactone hydrolase